MKQQADAAVRLEQYRRDFQIEEKERQRARQPSEREQREEKERRQRAKELMFSHLREATSEEYSAWLTGYLERGGKPSYFFDFPMRGHKMYVAQDNFVLVPLPFLESISIIIPTGIKVKIGWWNELKGYRHTLFFMKNFEVRGGNCFVPVYADTRVGLSSVSSSSA